VLLPQYRPHLFPWPSYLPPPPPPITSVAVLLCTPPALATSPTPGGLDLPLCADGQGFFTSLERIRCLFHIIEAPDYEEPGCAAVDLDKLVTEGVFDSYFCLEDKQRMAKLDGTWVYAPMYTKPPIGEIRDYLGEKIALYFAWINLYTNYLGLLGLVALVPTVMTVLNKDADNAYAAAYGFVSAVWAQVFLEHWKRETMKYQFIWNTEDFEDEEVLRPEFRLNVRKLKRKWEAKHGADTRPSDVGFITRLYDPKIADFKQGKWSRAGFVPVDEKDEHLSKHVENVEYFRESTARNRFILSSLFAVFLVAFICLVSTCLLAGKVYLASYGGNWVSRGPIVAALANVLFIRIMSFIWSKVGFWLNDWEMHRTDTEWEDSYIAKTFAFQFINSYLTTFYIAFVQGVNFTFPIFKDHNGYPLRDHCAGNDCFDALAYQVVTLVVTGQLARYAATVVPALVQWIKGLCATTKEEKHGIYNDVVAQSKRATFTGTYDEYIEMAIQFGWVCMFAVAFPLGSLVCFFTNMGEKRSDAIKITKLMRRPKYFGAQDIGSVMGVLETIGLLSVITNGLILYLSSEAYLHLFPKSFQEESPKYHILVFTVLAEHVVIATKNFVSYSIPDVPPWVEAERAKASMRAAVDRHKLTDAMKRRRDEHQRRLKEAKVSLDDDGEDEDLEI